MELRPKSFEVLRYLAEHAGRVVTKDELINVVWPTVTVSDASLNTKQARGELVGAVAATQLTGELVRRTRLAPALSPELKSTGLKQNVSRANKPNSSHTGSFSFCLVRVPDRRP